MPRPTAQETPDRAFEKAFREIAREHQGWRVFADFCEMVAISLQQVMLKCPDREARYMEIVRRYTPEQAQLFKVMLHEGVIEGLDLQTDFLGRQFMALELGNHWRGQFFTPMEVCRLMAALNFDREAVQAHLAGKGFVTLNDPACGAGATLIAYAGAMLNAEINPQEHLHVTAIDVDSTAAFMCYIQLSLLGIPALVYIGNTLTMEMRHELRTPAHDLGLWDWRLRAARQASPDGAGEEAPAAAGADEVQAEPDIHPPLPMADVTLPGQMELFAA